MVKYVRRNGKFVDSDGNPMELPFKGQICMPAVISDIPSYQSPIDGRVIGGRAERREDLKRNNCVEYEPSLSPTKGKIRNKSFAAKRGLKVSEEFL